MAGLRQASQPTPAVGHLWAVFSRAKTCRIDSTWVQCRDVPTSRPTSSRGFDEISKLSWDRRTLVDAESS